MYINTKVRGGNNSETIFFFFMTHPTVHAKHQKSVEINTFEDDPIHQMRNFIVSTSQNGCFILFILSGLSNANTFALYLSFSHTEFELNSVDGSRRKTSIHKYYYFTAILSYI